MLIYADMHPDTLLNVMATPRSRMEPNKAGNATCHVKETPRPTAAVLQPCLYSKLTYSRILAQADYWFLQHSQISSEEQAVHTQPAQPLGLIWAFFMT